MAYQGDELGQLRARNDKIKEQLTEVDAKLAAYSDWKKEIAEGLQDNRRKGAVLQGLMELAAANIAAGKEGTADKAEMFRNLLDALRDARDLVGGEDGFDELIAQMETMAQKVEV
ncbi:hypothetical protein [Yoonia sp.]|uniref:hypothetical protein n=1 Tax=Yoonia sp. TaxID=2212373 RepID=UPI00391CCE0E